MQTNKENNPPNAGMGRGENVLLLGNAYGGGLSQPRETVNLLSCGHCEGVVVLNKRDCIRCWQIVG